MSIAGPAAAFGRCHPTRYPARRRTVRAVALLCALALAWVQALPAARAAAVDEPAQPGAPYVPTPWPVVRAMLDLARVADTDVVVDLGSGDGRVVIEAARSRGARGFGVELDAELVQASNEEARRLGLSDRVRFEQRDLFETDLSSATVVTLYLLPRLLVELQPRLLRLRPGTRIVSHDFRFGDWKPDATGKVEVPVRAFGPPWSTVYLWIVPAYVDGAWEGGVEDRGRVQRFRADLRQDYQSLSGTLRIGARSARIEHATLSGDRIRFAARFDGPGGAVRHAFDGRSVGGELVGEWSIEPAGRAAGGAIAPAPTLPVVARRPDPARPAVPRP
jgi:SAM-dependent methyltransferase